MPDGHRNSSDLNDDCQNGDPVVSAPAVLSACPSVQVCDRSVGTPADGNGTAIGRNCTPSRRAVTNPEEHDTEQDEPNPDYIHGACTLS